MFSFLKSKFNSYTNIFKVSIGIALLAFFCCSGFATFTKIKQICPESKRIILAPDTDCTYTYYYLTDSTDNLTDDFSQSKYELVQMSDDRLGNPDNRAQTVLLRKLEGNGYIYALRKNSPIEPIDVTPLLPKEDRVLVSRDGNKLVIFRRDDVEKKDTIDIYKIERDQNGDPTKADSPICTTYTSTSGQVIVPESVSINGGNCISFKECNESVYPDLPTNSELRKSAFISDDGYRELVDNDTLYLWGGSGWGNGIKLEATNLPYYYDSASLYGHSNSLQFFSFLETHLEWREEFYTADAFYYNINTHHLDYDPGDEIENPNVLYLSVMNDKTLLKW